MFISFEGGDGVGKTTQIDLFAEYLTRLGRPFIQTKEPGGTALGMQLRAILLQKQEYALSPMETLLLMLTARQAHIERVIKPALGAGKIVLCDRFSDSTMAYQGYGEGLSLAYIKKLSGQICGNFAPQLTFLLHNGQNTIERAIQRENTNGQGETRFESMGQGFQQRVKAGFLKIAKQNPARVRLINANQPINRVHEDILTIWGKMP